MIEQNTAEKSTTAIDPKDPAVLDLIAKSVEEQTAAIKRNRDEIMAEKTKAREELKKLTDAVGGEDGLRSLIEMKERLSKDETGKLLAEGKHDEWLARQTSNLKTSHAKEVESLSARIKELEAAATDANAKLTNYRVRAELDTAFAAAGVDPASYDMVAHYLSARVGIDDDGFFVKDPRGDMAFSSGGKKMSVRELVESLRETQKALFLPTVGGGARGGNAPRNGIKNPWSKEAFNITEQGRIMKENPDLAAQMKAAAGI